ncbi:MAG: hypothetical protein OCD02_20275 [Spirochaetaceae bacterium]
MRKIYIIILLSFTFLINAETKPIIQVDQIINLSEEEWLDALCLTITDSISLTLRLLGRYSVKNVNSDITNDGEIETLRKRSEDNGFDNIIYGSCSFENDEYIITINAYDRAQNKITYSGSKSLESIFDSFDATDQIIDETIEGFSGIHVTYGSLRLIPPKTSEPFSIKIDDFPLQNGEYSIKKIPSGKHNLTVIQERPLGLYNKTTDLLVTKDIENRSVIPIPYITKEESGLLNSVDREIATKTINGEINLESVLDDAKTLTMSSFFKDNRQDLTNKYNNWLDHLTINSVAKSIKPLINRNVTTIWDNDKNKGVYKRDVSLSEIYYTESKARYKSRYPDFKTITIDGKADDWDNVKYIIKDFQNDRLKSNITSIKGLELTEARIAYDTEYLYIMIKTKDQSYNDKRVRYAVHLDNKPAIRFGLFFNLGEELKSDQLYVSAHIPNSNDHGTELNHMKNKTKYRASEVFEIAIPMIELLKIKEIEPGFNFYIGADIIESDDRVDELYHNNETKIPFMKVSIVKTN